MQVCIEVSWNSVGCCERLCQDLAFLLVTHVFLRCLCNSRPPRTFKMVVFRAGVASPNCFCHMGEQGVRLA